MKLAAVVAISRRGAEPADLATGFRFGAGEGNRTPDPLITNQMLYQLSYAS